METSISDANHAVLHAQSDRCGQGPIETTISGANHAVLHAQNDRCDLGPIETCISDPKVAVLPGKTSDEGWDSLRLVILVLKALFCICILVLISLFCMHTTTGEICDP